MTLDEFRRLAGEAASSTSTGINLLNEAAELTEAALRMQVTSDIEPIVAEIAEKHRWAVTQIQTAMRIEQQLLKEQASKIDLLQRRLA